MLTSRMLIAKKIHRFVAAGRDMSSRMDYDRQCVRLSLRKVDKSWLSGTLVVFAEGMS